jgi:hypothetical protein
MMKMKTTMKTRTSIIWLIQKGQNTAHRLTRLQAAKVAKQHKKMHLLNESRYNKSRERQQLKQKFNNRQ